VLEVTTAGIPDQDGKRALWDAHHPRKPTSLSCTMSSITV
jgi:hypothetical protein